MKERYCLWDIGGGMVVVQIRYPFFLVSWVEYDLIMILILCCSYILLTSLELKLTLSAFTGTCTSSGIRTYP